MKQITLDFDDNNTAWSDNIGSGLYNAAKVTVNSGTFTNVVISDGFNGTVATITDQNRTDLYTNSYGITTPITVTPSGVTGTITVTIQFRDA